MRNRPAQDKPTGVGSDDGSNEINPVYGSSKYPWLTSFLKYVVLTGGTGVIAWYAHPYLLDELAELLKLDYKESVTAFQTSFFSCLSLLFAIFSGNSMAFLYERQKELVRVFYVEVAALEDVLEEAVYALGTDARTILVQIRKYVDQEIRAPNNQLPPLEDGLALMTIRSEARRFKEQGAHMDDVLAASARLSDAQTQRQAISCRILPGAHWALLYVIAFTFVLTFIMFETGGSFSSEGRHTLWTLLCSLMVFVLTVLNDLADPSEGVYSATALMEERLSYTHRMLARHYQMPIVPEAGTKGRNANTNAYLNRLSTGGDGIPQPPARSNGDGIMPTDDQSSSNSANQTPRQNRPEEAPLRLVAEAKSAVLEALTSDKDNGNKSSANGVSSNGSGGASAANGAQPKEQPSKTPAAP